MPEMIPLGWFHTIMGIIALVTGAATLFSHREISLRTRSGQIYLLTTLITAATALAIYQRGVFGPAHVLAVAALGALAGKPTSGTRRGLHSLFGLSHSTDHRFASFSPY